MELQTFLRLTDVMRATGLPRSTIYELVGREQFPKPVPISARRTGWIEAEIKDWQARRIALRGTAPKRIVPRRKTEAA
jgi:prophage regulatory protein